MIEVRIMKFSSYGGPIGPVFLRDKFHPKILMGSLEWGRQTREVWETGHLTALNVTISKTVGVTAKVTINH